MPCNEIYDILTAILSPCSTVYFVDTFSSCARAEHLQWDTYKLWLLKSTKLHLLCPCMRLDIVVPPPLPTPPSLPPPLELLNVLPFSHLTRNISRIILLKQQPSNGKSFDKKVQGEVKGEGSTCSSKKTPPSLHYALGQPVGVAAVLLLLVLFSIVGNNSYGTLLSLYFNAL